MKGGDGFGMIPRHLRGHLTAIELAVYVALSWRLDEQGCAYPSHKTLADEAGTSVASARRALETLRDLGLVTWEGRLDPAGDKTSNLYRIAVHRAVDPEQTSAHPDRGVRSEGADGPLTVSEELEPEERDSEEREASAAADVSRDDVERLCQHLADRIVENGSRRPSVTKAWRTAARLLMDKDGRPETEIHGAIDWCQNHEFWRGNILSMPKLREKYDQMRLQAEQRSSKSRSDDIDWDAAFRRAQAREAEEAVR